MSYLHQSLSKAFNITKIVKEKGYFKTQNTKIRKTKDTPEQILAKYEVSEHIIKAGYIWTDRYHLAADGQPYAHVDGDLYIMTELVRCLEANFSDELQLTKITEAIARWHDCARGVKLSHPLQKGRTSIPLPEEYQCSITTLDTMIKRVRKNSKWSDFDILFLKYYEDYRDRIQKAQNLLEHTGYNRRYQIARQRNHICHGGLKEDCLLVCGDRIYITKLDSAVVDYQLTDLCSFIRRVEKKSHILERNQIFEAYSRIMPLAAEEEVILEAMLMYPQSFVKLVTEYYQKKRSWTPVAMTNKMREILSLY